MDVSMQEAVATTTEHVNTTFNYTGESAVRCGFRHGGQFVATWQCRDGYMSITTNTQKAWDDLRAWMEREGMAGDLMDDGYNDQFILRGEHSSHIEGLIEAWTLTLTRRKITEWGQANHHPWGPVATASEILDNGQLLARGFYLEMDDEESNRKVVYPGSPYKLSGSGWQFVSPAPEVGQHNRQVYCDELGLSDGELQDLSESGVA